MENVAKRLNALASEVLSVREEVEGIYANKQKDIFLDMTDGMEDDDVKLQKARVALIEKIKSGDLDDYIFITEITDFHSGYELHKTNIEVVVPKKKFYGLAETRVRSELKDD